MSNPTQQQIAFAYEAFLKRHNGDGTAAMADVATFVMGYSDPPPVDPTHPEMTLDQPAMVGHTIFSNGQPWFAVVSRAQEEYAQREAPQPSGVRIAEFREWIEAGMPPEQTAK